MDWNSYTSSELVRHTQTDPNATERERLLANRLDDYVEREEALEQEKERLEDQVGEKDEEIRRLNDRLAETEHHDMEGMA